MSITEKKEIYEADDPLNKLQDLYNERAREMLIFMEETKIWQEMVSTCAQQNGVAAYKNCKHLYEVLEERLKYYHSHYDNANYPKLSSGLPEHIRYLKK